MQESITLINSWYYKYKRSWHLNTFCLNCQTWKATWSDGIRGYRISLVVHGRSWVCQKCVVVRHVTCVGVRASPSPGLRAKGGPEELSGLNLRMDPGGSSTLSSEVVLLLEGRCRGVAPRRRGSVAAWHWKVTLLGSCLEEIRCSGECACSR